MPCLAPATRAPLPLVALAVSVFAAHTSAFAAPQSLGCLHTLAAPCPEARYDVAALAYDNRLYVLGGFRGLSVTASARFDVYEVGRDEWVQLADLPRLITHAPVVQVDEELWLIGGFVGDHPGMATEEVWRYDIALDHWSPGPPLPHPIAGGAAARLGTRVHYFGGLMPDRDTGSPDHFVFDTAAPGLGWQARAPLPNPRNHMGGAAWQGQLWAVGGQLGHDTNPVDSDLVHVYDPALDRWSEGPRLPMARSHAEGATFAEGAGLYVVAGYCTSLAPWTMNDVTLLEAGASAWRALPQLPLHFVGGAAGALNGELFVTNGSNSEPREVTEVHRRALDAEAPLVWRLNCGGGATVAGVPWCEDTGFERSSAAAAPPGQAVAGTAYPELYLTQRQGTGAVDPTRLRYRLVSQPGAVRVRLHFAELWSTQPGQRVVDVVLQGVRHDAALDVFAEVGPDHALERSYDVDAPYGVVEVELVASAGVPSIAAIELEALGLDHLQHRCVVAAGAGVHLELLGSTSSAEAHALLAAEGAPQGRVGVLLQSQGDQGVNLGGLVLCIGPGVFRRGFAASSGNELRFPLDFSAPGPFPPPLTPGSRWYFQAWYRGPNGAQLSDALGVSFTP
ncbi:MAG: malectin domain-containing carbohydrate-binding protein [Planctomycetota bacterium]